jgi:hypothetical protein
MLNLRSNSSAVLGTILDRLHQLHPGGRVYDHAMQEAAHTQLQNCRQRIHVLGTASDGTDIGQYSSTPIYVNPARGSYSFAPVGKTGKTTFASTGQPHLTRYFDAGYRAFREAVGLPADKVVLTLRGDLRDGLSVIRSSAGYGLGWSDERLYDLSQALERKYAKHIWAATFAERSEMVNSISEKVRETISK